jgi:hypothetical protein
MNPDRWNADLARQHLIEHLEELAQLTPALTEALARDHTPNTGTRIAVSGLTLSLPVNPDVLRALNEIPITYLPYYLADFEHAISTGDQATAKHITTQAGHWRRLAKRALGLLLYDRPLAQPCPQHDLPLTELVALGDEGWITQDSRGLYVKWLKDQRIWCRHCGSLWEPRQMLLLGRLLRWAEKRRNQTAAQDDDTPADLEIAA